MSTHRRRGRRPSPRPAPTDAPTQWRLPVISPTRRINHGSVYHGRRLLPPRWRRRIKIATAFVGLVGGVSVGGGLAAGHLMLTLITP